MVRGLVSAPILAFGTGGSQKHLGELAQIWYDDSISMGSERQEPL